MRGENGRMSFVIFETFSQVCHFFWTESKFDNANHFGCFDLSYYFLTNVATSRVIFVVF